MNNMKDKGVQLDLDKPRTLRFDFNAMIDIDEKYKGINNAMKALSSDEPGRMSNGLRTMRYLAFKGLLHEDPELTEEKVGQILTYTTTSPAELSNCILEALGIALPDPEEGEAPKNE